jgi:nucleotide-binding universal stress UspA family protein
LFENLLVPLDGSEHSLRALDLAMQIAKESKGKLTLIHVYSVSVRPVILPEPAALTPSSVSIVTAEEISKVAEANRVAGEHILTDGKHKAAAENVPVETMLREGQIVQEIVRASKEGKFDLIVIGARGMSKIRELLSGSVTDGVIRHSSCPVLVVK